MVISIGAKESYLRGFRKYNKFHLSTQLYALSCVKRKGGRKKGREGNKKEEGEKEKESDSDPKFRHCYQTIKENAEEQMHPPSLPQYYTIT